MINHVFMTEQYHVTQSRHKRKALSRGQTDRQVVASGRKLILCRDLRWLAKRTRKFPCKYTQGAKIKHFKAD